MIDPAHLVGLAAVRTAQYQRRLYLKPRLAAAAALDEDEVRRRPLPMADKAQLLRLYAVRRHAAEQLRQPLRLMDKIHAPAGTAEKGRGRAYLLHAALRLAARGETQCSMEEICAASAFLCRTGGSVNFVHKPERLSELFCCMTAHGIEPKQLRLVCHREGAAPNLVLIEGRRGGKPGLKIEPTLILRRPDGSETDEVRRIYHR